MAGHKDRDKNARAHDARTLLDVALRMQMRGDEFALADQVLSVASQLRALASEGKSGR